MLGVSILLKLSSFLAGEMRISPVCRVTGPCHDPPTTVLHCECGVLGINLQPYFLQAWGAELFPTSSLFYLSDQSVLFWKSSDLSKYFQMCTSMVLFFSRGVLLGVLLGTNMIAVHFITHCSQFNCCFCCFSCECWLISLTFLISLKACCEIMHDASVQGQLFVFALTFQLHIIKPSVLTWMF